MTLILRASGRKLKRKKLACSFAMRCDPICSPAHIHHVNKYEAANETLLHDLRFPHWLSEVQLLRGKRSVSGSYAP